MRGEARHLATVKEYSELMAALRGRADELNVPRETLDAISGLANGYCAKLLAPVPIRAVGPTSLGPLLQALGLALIVVEDLTAFEKIATRLRKRQRKDVYATAGMLPRKRKRFPKIWRGNSEWGRLMNSRAVLKMSEIDLQRRAKKAADARWRGKRHRDRNAAAAIRVPIKPV